MSLDTVLAGLVGSLVTVIATKVLDIIQKSKEHRYSLQKIFFEKKLQSAEAAVAEWYSVASSCLSLATLYDQLSSEEKEIEGELASHFSEVFYSRLQKVQSVSNQISDAIFLYFDIDESSFWDNESLRKLFISFSQINALSESLSIFTELKDHAKGTESERIIQTEIERMQKEARTQVRALSAVFDKSYKDMVSLIRKLRTDLKRFDR